MPSTPKPKAAPRKPVAKPSDKAAKPTDKPVKKVAVKADPAPRATKSSLPSRGQLPPAGEPDSVATILAEAPTEQGGKAGQGLKMKALIDEVAARSGAKKTEAKPIVETVLSVLGDALARGEGLTLPGLGKVKVAKTKASAGGEVLTLKLKRGAEKNAKTPLAAADD